MGNKIQIAITAVVAAILIFLVGANYVAATKADVPVNINIQAEENLTQDLYLVFDNPENGSVKTKIAGEDAENSFEVNAKYLDYVYVLNENNERVPVVDYGYNSAKTNIRPVVNESNFNVEVFLDGAVNIVCRQ